MGARRRAAEYSPTVARMLFHYPIAISRCFSAGPFDRRGRRQPRFWLPSWRHSFSAICFRLRRVYAVTGPLELFGAFSSRTRVLPLSFGRVVNPTARTPNTANMIRDVMVQAMKISSNSGEMVAPNGGRRQQRMRSETAKVEPAAQAIYSRCITGRSSAPARRSFEHAPERATLCRGRFQTIRNIGGCRIECTAARF
jgi:hypothetical protein